MKESAPVLGAASIAFLVPAVHPLLNDVLRDLEPMLRPILGPEIELVIEAGDPPPHLHVDRGHLEQVVLNLAVNARDAMPGGGTLALRTYEQHEARGGATVFEVADTGHGMDSRTVARIFEPFFTTKPPDKGTGIGLSTVNGIVRDWGGAIDVTSAPGKGAVFRVAVPLGNRPWLAADALPSAAVRSSA